MRGRRPVASALDLVACLLLVFAAVALLSTVSPPRARIDTLGLYAVTLRWDRGALSDLDLYIRTPSGRVVYFGNDDTDDVYLERDDIGAPSARNDERAVITREERGEYVVNVHAYHFQDDHPLRATLSLWRLRGEDRLLRTREIEIVRQGQERTAFRFRPPDRFSNLEATLVQRGGQ